MYSSDEGSSLPAGRAPGRPKPARASRETRLALQPSKPAQAGLEPRLSFPAGDRPMYPSDEGLH